MTTTISTHFDKQVVKLFDPGKDEVKLKTFSIKYSTKQLGYGYGNYYNRGQFTISQNGNIVETIPDGEFYSYFLERKSWGKSFIEEVEELLKEKQKAHTKNRAKQKKIENELEAKKLGITVEELIFRRKNERNEKQTEKFTKKIKEQIARTYDYNKLFDKVERRIAEAREILSTTEFDRLQLQDVYALQMKTNDFFYSINYSIKLKPIEEEKTKKKKK